MGQMVVRNIPDDVMERFKKAAKNAGISAEQLARNAIEEKAMQSRPEVIRQIEAIRAQTKTVDMKTATQFMKEIRDERDARPFIAGIDDDY